MTYKECENLYEEWEKTYNGEILIDGTWKKILDIEEDAHLGWVCILKDSTKIELIDIHRYNIRC
ncbi:MAG: hypothetical protein ACFFG0_00670 [Candidatus Thorarchaeota archaeon]